MDKHQNVETKSIFMPKKKNNHSALDNAIFMYIIYIFKVVVVVNFSLLRLQVPGTKC